ncbi:MAG TPA: hypothetical protein DD670_14405, partial [Planctomycetaceae bacterium]|nr:hypothetical protein [Planctomycetaceae bacterium]
MKTHGSNSWLPLLFLVVVAAGCQTVPPLPTDPSTRPEDASAKRNNYDDTDGDGWLLNRLFGVNGTDAKTADAATATPKFDPNVKQAGAVQPIPSLNDPNTSKRGIIYLADDADLDIVRDPDEAEDKDDSFSLFGWLPSAPEELYKNAKTAVGLGPDRKLAKQYLDEGLKLYEEKRFAEAAAKFKAAAGRWPDSALEEDALFLQGESLFFADNYPKSQD